MILLHRIEMRICKKIYYFRILQLFYPANDIKMSTFSVVIIDDLGYPQNCYVDVGKINYYGFMVLWCFGTMVLCYHGIMGCGILVTWYYGIGIIVLWYDLFLVLWCYGIMALWYYGMLVLKSYGIMI